MTSQAARPPFIVSTADVPETTHRYPERPDEPMASGRAIGRAAGLKNVGLHVVRVQPGQRTSFPHAESHEEEFAFVLEGSLDAWLDGVLHPIAAGDLVALPAGTGICHTFINNGDREARLLVGGDSDKEANRIFYPKNLEVRSRRKDWWSDVPIGPQGPHDGLPDAVRAAAKKP
ncbi:MAG: Hemolysin [Labilithrix sp.]|nr:Hemolysin [Labilithrix sp.]